MRLDHTATVHPSATPTDPPPRRPDARGNGAGPSPTTAAGSPVERDLAQGRALLRAILSTLDATAAALVLFHLEVWLRALAALRPLTESADASAVDRFAESAIPDPAARLAAVVGMRSAPDVMARAMARKATALLYESIPGDLERAVTTAVVSLFCEPPFDVADSIGAPPRFPAEVLLDVAAVRAEMFPAGSTGVGEEERAEDGAAEGDGEDEDETEDGDAEGRRPDPAPVVVRAVLSTLAPDDLRRMGDAWEHFIAVLHMRREGKHVPQSVRDAASDYSTDLNGYWCHAQAVCAALLWDTPVGVMAAEHTPGAGDLADAARYVREAIAAIEAGRA